MATNKQPTNTLRCGNIKATIWQNSSEKGQFFATTFSRPFKDESGAWRNGTSFGLNEGPRNRDIPRCRNGLVYRGMRESVR